MQFSYLKTILLLLMSFVSVFGYTQTLEWTGDFSSDFFEESNWVLSGTATQPNQDEINPNTPINYQLIIKNATNFIEASGQIQLNNASLTIENSQLTATSVFGGQLVLNTQAYVSLSSSSPFQGVAAVNFNSPIAWVKTTQVTPSELESSFSNTFSVNETPAVYQTNLRLDNYYLRGSVIRSIDASEQPLKLFSSENLQGNLAEIQLGEVQSANTIPNNLNNSAESFLLRKGHMVTFAVEDDGTGKSKTFIASEEDLIINKLPNYLRNDISYIRVIPWNWVTKKGRGGGGLSTLIQNTWFYHWNNNMDSTQELEYAPMAWGANGADDQSDIVNFQSKYKSTHVMAFNESDNCNDQSGQFNDLCQVEVAVDYYENLMKTGMRLVSPSGRENAPFGWLKDFYDLATEQDIRIDVIGVHWYDWASNPTSSPNANANQVFQRFATYLEDVHDLYGLPIWITEFNANPNRTNQVNYEFMQLALPYLESLDYVERYAWFEPNSDVADYTDANGDLTNVGTYISSFESSPAIPEATITSNNNLDNYQDLIDPTGENLIYNGFFETNDLTGWEGNNIAILNNAFEGNSSARILANPGEIFQIIDVEPNTVYDLSFYTKWFVPPSAPVAVNIFDTANNSIIATQTMTTNTNWNLIQFEFTTPIDVSEIKLSVSKGNEPGWFIDNAVMFKIETLSLQVSNISKGFEFYPNPSSGKIKINSDQKLLSISIFNLQGKLIKKVQNINKKTFIVELNNVNSGVYTIQATNRVGNLSHQKLIVH